ncbi:hypothetical protein ACHAWT_009484 [Skeletonema menzelii]
MDNSSDASSSNSKEKRDYSKRGVEKCDYDGTTCICCDKRCDTAMAILKEQNNDRFAYFILPKEPTPEHLLANRPNKNQVRDRANKSLKRKRMLQALPPAARVRVGDDGYSSNTKFVIASLHFPDEVYQLCRKDSNGNRRLCDSIPSVLANRLSRKSNSETYTTSDQYKDGTSTYVPLPNVRPEDIFARGDTMRENKRRAATSTPAAAVKKTRSSPVSAEVMQVDALQETLARDAAQREVQMQELRAREQELRKKQKEAASLMEKAVRMQQEATNKLQLYIVENEAYGLTRKGFISKEWHKNNPNAARHFFGFQTFKELVYYLHALFGVLPPSRPEETTKKTPIQPFEKYLMGFMRIHTGMTVESIATIWGRKDGTASDIITAAVKSIGNAGKDLSILDITEEYLLKTIPQQYVDEGLERCCGVPDGKDFKIYTTRKNTMFTRASYSDKVHASAVRCISWSTPHGLSFEHTDLFLGRVSEKKLVELWGPRLRKCPRGWYMLSDRGFFDTARFYPNMNHQKTPKFLSGRDQFTTDEISADRKICKLRYTCEVAFSRVTKTKGLRDVISNDFFVILDAMNDWAHATVNLDAPLMQL